MSPPDVPAARYLVAWMPAFRVERCGFAASDVAAVVAEVKGAVRIVAATPAALELGLRPGVTATEARALAPDVRLLPLDAQAEREDRAALLRAMEAVSDRVSFAWDDAIVAEISTTAAAHGGERAAAERAGALLTDFGHEHRLAVADDPLAALGFATGRPGTRVYLHPPRAPLGELLLLALRPPEGLRDALRVVGLRTCADLAALSASSVVGRYGRDGQRLRRIALGEHVGLGEVVEVGTADELRVSTALPGATTRGELSFALPGLLGLLVRRLAEADRAVVRLRVVLELDGGARRMGSVRLGRPTRSVPRLERAIRSRLDSLVAAHADGPGSELPAVPIDELRLEVEESAPEVGWQPGLTDRAEHREPLPDLLSRLADQLGPEAVFRTVPAAVWRPETSWRPAPFPAPNRELLPSSRPARPPALDVVDEQELREHGHPLPRPALLLERPERLEVVVDDGAPIRVRLPLSTATGRDAPPWLPVARRAGPERLYGEWWSATVLDREYWVVEVDGRAAWIFRDPSGAWALHGWFD